IENHLNARIHWEDAPEHDPGRGACCAIASSVEPRSDAMDKDRIAGSAKDLAGKVEGAAGDISGNAQTQAAGRAREAAGTAQNLYGQAKDAARDASDAAVSYAKDAYENSGETFRDGSQAVAKKVQDNPLGALLIAGGIGFALALLMTRPPRRPPPRWRYRD